MQATTAAVRQNWLPNWAVAGLLAFAAAGTYAYTIKSVNTNEVDRELEKAAAALAKQKAAQK